MQVCRRYTSRMPEGARGGTIDELLPNGDAQLKLAVRRAAWIGQLTRAEQNSDAVPLTGLPDSASLGAPTVSFASLWLGLMTGRDEIAEFIHRTSRVLDLKVEKIVAELRRTVITTEWSFNSGRIRQARSVAESALPSNDIELTPSAAALLNYAEETARQIGTSCSTSHVLASFVIGPIGNHIDTYQAWGFRAHAWRGLTLEMLSDPLRQGFEYWVSARPGNQVRFSARVMRILELGAAYSDGLTASTLSADAIFVGTLVEGSQGTRQTAPEWLSSIFVSSASSPERTLAQLLELPTLPSAERARSVPHLSPEAFALLMRAMAIGEMTDLESEVSRQQSAFGGAIGTPDPTRPPEKLARARHLVFALLTRPQSPLARKLFQQAGKRAGQVRRDFIEWLIALVGPANAAVYKRFIPNDGEYHIAGYDNDEAHGKDRLRITRDVNALGAVLASSRVNPPLSVGLFGDWGSGKSFFMSLLKTSIEAFAERGREFDGPEEQAPFCSNIVQIDFNAWHYVDGNLWASLVTHIFDELNAALADKKQTVDDYALTLETMKTRSAELESEKKALATAADTLQTKIDGFRQQRESKQLSWKDYYQAIVDGRDGAVQAALDKAAEKLGLKDVQLTVEEIQAERAKLSSVLRRVEVWLRILWHEPRRAVYAVAWIVVPMLIAYLAKVMSSNAPNWTIASSTLVSLVGLVATFRKQFESGMRLVDKALSTASDAQAWARAQMSEQERAAKEERKQLAAMEAKLAQDQLSLAERQAAVEAELAMLKDGRSFKKLVLERAASSDYRKQLGLVATVHNDFRELSKRLLAKEDNPHIQRIVLYVDDLDRCPPDRVVEVLQAVHLLLSMPLFVVVVAVDPAWLLQSLEAYYRKHFSDGLAWGSRPQHYLEKIIQIPFSIPRMTEAGFGSLVRSMLERHIGGDSAAPPTDSSPDPSSASGVVPEGPEVEPHAAPLPTIYEPPSDALEDEELDPQALLLTAAECAHAASLAPLIASPRAAKRFVNIYRIVRAALPQPEVDAFANGGFKATQLMLALVIGSPPLSARMFRALAMPDGSTADLLDRFVATAEHELPGEVERARWMQTQLAPLSETEIRDAALAVRRYSLDAGLSPATA